MTDNPKTMTVKEKSEEVVRKLFWDGHKGMRAWEVVAVEIWQATDQARKEGFEQAREDCITQMHIEIQTLKEQSKMSGLQPLESELRRRVDNLRDLQPPRDGK